MIRGGTSGTRSVSDGSSAGALEEQTEEDSS